LAPVVEVDMRLIGAGVPGDVTRELIKRFHDFTQTSGTPVYV
jgi:hypothetical protein